MTGTRLISAPMSVGIAADGFGSGACTECCKSSSKGILSRFYAKLKRYFSGKMAAVQIIGGVGAFAGRSLMIILLKNQPIWAIVLASQAGSFVGYVGTYIVAYQIAFRRDYKTGQRSIMKDIFRLQLVEQVPNIFTLIPAALMQGALMWGTAMPTLVAANVASIFGIHKIVNLMAMAGSNSMKKAMVDGSWNPAVRIRNAVAAIVGITGNTIKITRAYIGSSAVLLNYKLRMA